MLESKEKHVQGGEHAWAVVSDLDLVAAALHGGLGEHTAGRAAGSPVVLISGSDSPLDVAAALVGEHVRSGPPRAERSVARTEEPSR